MCIYILVHTLFFSGTGHQSKFFWSFGCPHRLAHPFKKQRSVLRKTGKRTSSENQLFVISNMRRYSSQCIRPFLCLGRRGKFNLLHIFSSILLLGISSMQVRQITINFKCGNKSFVLKVLSAFILKMASNKNIDYIENVLNVV